MRLNTIELGDSRELSLTLPDSSIDFIFTDPPYAHKFIELYRWLAEEAARLLKPGGFLITYSGTYYLPEVISALEAHLTYYWQFIVLHPGAMAFAHGRKIQQSYKPILCYSKGAGLIEHYYRDTVTSPKEKQFHHWGQAESTAYYFIDRFTKPGDTVWEPFSGGGTVPYICTQQARQFYASEIDPIAHATSSKRLELIQMPLIF